MTDTNRYSGILCREEASQIPHLLVAPKVQIGPQQPPDLQDQEDENDDGDVDYDDEHTDGILHDSSHSPGVRGYYDDGAYIALPDDAAQDSDSDEKALTEAYFASTLQQYQRIRGALHAKCPADAAKRLSRAQITHAAPFGPNSNTTKVWTGILRNADPHPLQLALMSKETVIRVIRVLLGGRFLRRGYTLTERTSQWIWGLLARLPDRGELNHLEIGWVRDLGRRAVLLGRSLAEMAALREGLADGDLGVNEGMDASSDDEQLLASNTDSSVENGVAQEAGGNPEEEENEIKKGEVEIQMGGETPLKNIEGEEAGCQDSSMNGQVKAEDDGEEGEVEETGDEEDVAMDLGSGSESDAESDEALEVAKRGLLARLDGALEADGHDEEVDAQEEVRMRLRMNMRATLNMILTVAGEFYGQRDLLEFREPFVGM